MRAAHARVHCRAPGALERGHWRVAVRYVPPREALTPHGDSLRSFREVFVHQLWTRRAATIVMCLTTLTLPIALHAQQTDPPRANTGKLMLSLGLGGTS